jgi:hypothetical protein
VALDLDLQELIATVEKGAADDALARLQAAAGAAEELTVTADVLLGHFVGAAREAGASWTQIGGALGVTKQGAQQRFGLLTRDPAFFRGLLRRGPAHARRGARMRVDLPWLQRFTVRARRSISAAAEESGRWNHEHVKTEHLLLGLLSEPDGLAVKALESCGHTAEATRAAVEAKLQRGAEPLAYRGGLAPDTMHALHRTMSEALRLGHNYIGTEHILLSLMKEEEGLAAETLRELGLSHAQLEQAVVELLADDGED